MKVIKKNKIILVTGGAGYLGSVLIGELLQAGYTVRVIDSLMFGGEALLSFVRFPNFSLIQGDIRDRDLVKKQLDGVFGVCHLAALVGEPACKVNPAKTEEINFLATQQLVELSQGVGVKRLIFTSTCSNYGVTKSTEEADETYPLHPLSLYAETKIKAEKIVLQSHNQQFCPSVLRFATLFGVSAKMRFNLLISEWVRDAYFGKSLVVYRPEAWRPFLYIRDAALAIISVLQAAEDVVSGEVFNVVSENQQKSMIVSLLQKHFPSVLVSLHETRDVDLRDYKVSSEKIRGVLGFAPKFRIEDGIVELKRMLSEGMFFNPYDEKYSLWLKEELL